MQNLADDVNDCWSRLGDQYEQIDSIDIREESYKNELNQRLEQVNDTLCRETSKLDDNLTKQIRDTRTDIFREIKNRSFYVEDRPGPHDKSIRMTKNQTKLPPKDAADKKTAEETIETHKKTKERETPRAQTAWTTGPPSVQPKNGLQHEESRNERQHPQQDSTPITYYRRPTPINIPRSNTEQDRTNNLIITGIKEKNRENSKDEISKIAQVLHIFFTGNYEAQRIGKPTGNKDRPILIEFEKQWDKRKLYMMRASLKEIEWLKNVYMNEDLNKEKSRLFYLTRKAREKKYIANTWIYQGEIYISKTQESRPIQITNLSKLTEVIPEAHQLDTEEQQQTRNQQKPTGERK